MNIQTTDELIQWLRKNTMEWVDTTSYINDYLVKTVDTLMERGAKGVRVSISMEATYSEDREIKGYLLGLVVYENEQIFSAQNVYFPVFDGKISGILVVARPGA
jgi:hypothetical protein